MYLKVLLVAVLGALVSAQSGVNRIVPVATMIQAGQPTTINWAPDTPGTVSLQLRWGSADNLIAGVPIASGIPNNGAYTWTPDKQLKAGSDYTIEIINDADKAQTNFSPVFGIASNGQGYPDPTSAPPAAATTTTTVNIVASSSKVAESSVEASKSVHESAKTTSTKATPHATTNAAARIKSGVTALAGVGAVVMGVL